MEELLGSMRDDGDEDEYKDALELKTEGTAPAPPPPEMETQAGSQGDETAEAMTPAETEDLPADLKAPAGTAGAAALPERLGKLPTRTRSRRFQGIGDNSGTVSWLL